MTTSLARPIARAAAIVLAVFAVARGEALEADGDRLSATTRSAWAAYVAATERRRVTEEGAGRGFLAMDFLAGAIEDRRAVLDGHVVVHRMPVSADAEGPIDVPSALVHHWRGAVFLPRVTVPDLLARLERADPPVVQDDVLRAVVLSKAPGAARVFLRLRRQKIVTVVYNTEHDVRFFPEGPSRGRSSSTATKIAEVRAPGTPAERELPPGEDRGFLWRLNAYWRYEAVPGGVIAECESVSLSRDVPFGLRAFVAPVIASTARESMETALGALRARFAG